MARYKYEFIRIMKSKKYLDNYCISELLDAYYKAERTNSIKDYNELLILLKKYDI